MKSLYQKIVHTEGLIDTKDISEWESDFLRGITERAHVAHKAGQQMPFSQRQIEIIEKIHDQHFAS